MFFGDALIGQRQVIALRPSNRQTIASQIDKTHRSAVVVEHLNLWHTRRRRERRKTGRRRGDHQ
jgi:hypothetical protein